MCTTPKWLNAGFENKTRPRAVFAVLGGVSEDGRWFAEIICQSQGGEKSLEALVAVGVVGGVLLDHNNRDDNDDDD